MRTLYLLLLFLLPLLTTAQVSQTTDNGAICREGKIRSLHQRATNAKARLAYPGDGSIDVTYYGLDLRLTHTPNSLTGIASITLKSTASSASSFFLDLNSTTATSGAGLHVDSVKVGNQKLAFRHEQNKLIITPTQPLNNGQVMTVTVFYQGIPNTQPSVGSFVFSTHDSTTDPAIWTLSEPYGAPDWFPCKDSPADKADSSAVRITAPALFVSVSNGTLESTTTNPDGTRTYQWRNHYPIAQYLISIACTNYQRYDTPFSYGNQTLPITHYIYPETLPVVKSALDQTPGIMRLFTDRFGPYPFLSEKYGHAQFGFRNGGMEHQTISSMEQGALTPGVIAHELAHQWFGDKITCRDWQHIWLNEGFASYAESIYAESVNGQTGYQANIANFMRFARNARGSIYVQDISNSDNIFNSDRTYSKGAVVLHMLRNIVGDSTFFRTLRTYAASPTVAYKSAVTEDFQAVAEQVSGQKLGYFFQQWIYGEGYPTYLATYATNGPAGGNVTVRLTQRNTISTNPASFTMPVQIRVESTAGDTTVTVFNDRADQTFTLPARGLVKGITVDPNNRILKAVDPSSLVTAVDEPTTGGLRVYPNPTAETLSVDFTVPSTGPVTLALTTLTGQRIRQLSDVNLTPGNYTRTFNLRGLSAGRYLVTIIGPGGPLSRVVLVR